jgi:hypothetical protein
MGIPRKETRPEHFSTDAERRAYQRGYQCREWPAHKPPEPPPSLVRDVMKAASELRDEADYVCSTLDPNDEFVQRLGPKIDAVDWAMTAITEWLKSD